MTDKPPMTLIQIKARTSGKSFSRGESYYYQGAISNPILRDNTIEAHCQGSYPQPYRVSVEFSGSEIADTRCNCEYDLGGDCKHIVALLLTYFYEPEKFEEKPPMTNGLTDKSKDDLISIIQQMVARYPDLQSIIDRPTPTQVTDSNVELDTTAIRKELNGIFIDMYDDYDDYDYDYHSYGGYSSSAEAKITEFRELAKKFTQKQDWLGASQIYRAILEEFIEIDEDYFNQDEEGYLGTEIDLTISELGMCLAQDVVINNTSERNAILNALLDVNIWNTDIGGYDIGHESHEIILNYIQTDDIPSIRKKIEDARERQKEKAYGQWGVEAYTDFLMDLDVLDEVDPEVTLKNLLEQGMFKLLARKLLELGRIDEAVQVVKEDITEPYEMLDVANLFASKDQSQHAQQLVEAYVEKKPDDRLVMWLINYYQQQSNIEKLLHWQQVSMRQRPTKDLYVKIKHNAQSLNQWDTIREEIIATLKHSKLFAMLITIYLIDEEWELAWQTLPEVKNNNYGWMYSQTEIEVADATRHLMPNRAIAVYKERIQSEIDARGRDHYQRAATLLAIVKQLYNGLNEQEKWNTLIQHIRTENKRLPALQDELKKAKL